MLAIARAVQTQHQSTGTLGRGKPKAPPRANKKAEILELRDQVARLKARVAQLQLRETPRTSGSVRPGALPLLLASTAAVSESPVGVESELQKMWQAEALNRTLRAALQKQADMGKRLMAVFARQSASIVRTKEASLSY